MKESKMDLFANALGRVANVMQSNTYISSITQGMTSTLPILIGGSIINLIVNLPIPIWTDFLKNVGIYGLLSDVVKIFQLIAIYIAFGIGRALGKKKGIDGTYSGLIAIVSYMLVLPYSVNETGDFILTTTYIGSVGIITAMIVSLLAVSIFAWVIKKNWVLIMPDSVPPNVAGSFKMIPPALLTAIPFIIIRGVLAATPFGNLPDLISTCIATPLGGVGNTFAGHAILLLLNSLLWWCGIHNMALMPILMAVLYPPLVANITANVSGTAIPNMLSLGSYMIPAQLIGGPGALFGLFICMAFFTKSARYKTQGKLQLIPGMFNITEPAMFGLPVVMNPIMLVPFVLAPQIINALLYAGLNMGILSTPVVDMNYFVPGPIAGFLIGGGIAMGIFLIIACLISCVVYFPFVKILDKQVLKDEEKQAA